MPTETRQDILARGNRLEQVNVANAAARTVGFVPFDGEQNGRNAITVGKARSNNTLNAFMPTFASNHQGTLAFEDAFSLLGSHFSKLRFDGATLGVHVFQFGRKVTRFSEIVTHQQIERQLGIAHASSRIQAGNDSEAQA